MTEQLQLGFGGPRIPSVRRKDPATAQAAWRSIVPKLPELERAVFAVIAGNGAQGATLDQVVEVTQLDKVSASPRLRPLARKGLIEDSGKRRNGTSGRPQIVWVVVSKSGN